MRFVYLTEKFIKIFFTTKFFLFSVVSLLFFILFGNFIFSATDLTQATAKPQSGIIYCAAEAITEATWGGSHSNSSICDTTIGVSPSLCQQEPDLCKVLIQNNINPNSYVPGGGVGMLAQVAYYATDGAVRNGTESVTYMASKFSNTVSAQTSALQGLSPILVLWGTLRNVTYVLIALSLVVTGLSIYFTNKQGKQDNLALAGSIVDILGTLITITFSYVIAGVAVDLVINLGNAAVAAFFQPFINSTSILNNLSSPGSGVNIMTLLADFQGSGSSKSVISLLQAGLSNLNTPLFETNTFFKKVIDTANLGPAGGAFSTFVNVVFTIARAATNIAINQPLITAIISFTIFILIFRVVFLLLGSFVAIVMQIAFAPLILIPGAFPGISSMQTFTTWLKRIIASALVFPTVFALLLLAAIFLNLNQETPGLNANSNSGDCVYDNSIQDPVPITGNYVNTQFNSSGDAKGTAVNRSSVFNTTRFQPQDPSKPSISGDQYANIRKCFPVLLPPKFNWLPQPLGNLGSKFEIDDFTRFVVGIAIIIMIPSIAGSIQGALKVKQPAFGSLQDAMAGAGLFNTFVAQVPILGGPISQITKGITGAIK
jgi:hypothetical protein